MQEKDKVTPTPEQAQESILQKGSEKGASTPLGKFADSEELAKAYKALEAEFTRRSQRLRELEKSAEEGKQAGEQTEGKQADWEEKVGNLFARYPFARTLSAEIEEYIKQNNNIIAENDCLEYALINVLSNALADKAEAEKQKDSEEQKELLRQQIIGEYLSSLNKQAPKIMPRGGLIPATAPLKPASIAEAGQLAKKILNS